ncbi:hypothetical protein [Pyrobaculum ferrireducens]|uniref:Uncharacterized protein n=1 Tax=Pyrobaculum ferrireducens TaxID=1104324 RepID=G7VEV2_9CREN|nr:hypothetical protein [Pyrobaculum ferrireducens]AET32918.1 hypothetical protein P186_1495 [Pyrobaculum ferrireducens]
MKAPRPRLEAAVLVAIVLVVALTQSDLSKYQDPLFPGVKMAKPATCR